MINPDISWVDLIQQYRASGPFNHVVIDNFWPEDTARALAAEFPAYDDPAWLFHYQNAIEDKKACNHWDRFPALTYRAFSYLNSAEFVKSVERIVGNYGQVLTDIGLHGGGWHCHHKGGKLNIHLDYSIHPKLKLERHYNLIVYMTPDWDPAWGGGLELWDHNPDGSAKCCARTIENRFNRAVLFDTTQHSWHGLPDNLNCPEGVNRQSMAVYYLTEPRAGIDTRGKALFVPHGEQAQDPEVLELIRRRSDLATATSVYRK